MVLEQYPLGLIEECADPRCGIACKVEFLSVKSLTDWLENRLAFYVSVARYVERPLLPVREFTEEERGQGLAALLGLGKAIVDGCTAGLTFEQAAAIGHSQQASGSPEVGLKLRAGSRFDR
mgnify:FL=1